MLETATRPPRGFRLLRRHAVTQAPVCVRIPLVRPSVLNPRLRGDLWVEPTEAGTAAVRCDSLELACVSASPLDLASLNQVLSRARTRRPRR
jgi:hypothetical protein